MKMKPETIKRRAAARKKRVKAGRKNLEKRLSEKAKQEGPDSIWAEMLAELRSKNPMHKKKRSAKQLANDRRLGRMAKARAKKKRGGRRKKVARKNPCGTNPHRRAASKGRIQAAIAKAKRTRSAKSHLWLIFACKGKIVQWMRLTTNAKYFFGGDKGKAIRFSTKSEALKIAKGLKGTRGWQVGIISDDISATQIAAHCTGGKA